MAIMTPATEEAIWSVMLGLVAIAVAIWIASLL